MKNRVSDPSCWIQCGKSQRSGLFRIARRHLSASARELNAYGLCDMHIGYCVNMANVCGYVYGGGGGSEYAGGGSDICWW